MYSDVIKVVAMSNKLTSRVSKNESVADERHLSIFILVLNIHAQYYCDLHHFNIDFRCALHRRFHLPTQQHQPWRSQQQCALPYILSKIDENCHQRWEALDGRTSFINTCTKLRRSMAPLIFVCICLQATTRYKPHSKRYCLIAKIFIHLVHLTVDPYVATQPRSHRQTRGTNAVGDQATSP